MIKLKQKFINVYKVTSIAWNVSVLVDKALFCMALWLFIENHIIYEMSLSCQQVAQL